MPQEDGPGGEVSMPYRPARLVDTQLLGEITLLTDVISAVSGHSQHLTVDEVDHLLGVSPHPEPARSEDGRKDGSPSSTEDRARTDGTGPGSPSKPGRGPTG